MPTPMLAPPAALLALALAAPVQTAPVALPAAAPSGELSRWDALWPRRDDPAAALELKGLAGDFQRGDDYARLWRAARWYFWLADGTKGDDSLKALLGKTGWDAGKKAKALKPKGLEGLYWTSVDIGMYSEAVGIFKALTQGLESRFRDPLLEVKAADPDHRDADIDYIGPELTLGRYWYSLPWPKRSLDRSKDELRVATKVRPENLRAHYFLAQTLAADGDYAGAKAELDAIRAGSVSYDPPEARRVKALAQLFATKIAGKLH